MFSGIRHTFGKKPDFSKKSGFLNTQNSCLPAYMFILTLSYGKWGKKMNSDITALKKQEKAARAYRQHLLTELNAAVYMAEHLPGDEKQQAHAAAEAIGRFRHVLYKKAEELGYPAACAKSISDCRGECCKWHFPANLDGVDLFLCIFSLSAEKRKELQARLGLKDDRHQCPFLDPDGCIFSFDTRPVACANAWPCFMSDAYHAFMEKERKEIRKYYHVLRELYDRILSSKVISENKCTGSVT